MLSGLLAVLIGFGSRKTKFASLLTKVTLFERVLANNTRILYDVKMKEKFHKSTI